MLKPDTGMLTHFLSEIAAQDSKILSAQDIDVSKISDSQHGPSHTIQTIVNRRTQHGHSPYHGPFTTVGEHWVKEDQ